MSMTLKAQFQRVDTTGALTGPVIPVSFNPTEYTLTKGAQTAEIAIPGLDSPILQFVRGQSESMTLDLFFDSTDGGMGMSATSVTEQTDPFYQLVKIDGTVHATPVVFFSWGPEFPGNRTYSSMGDGTGSQQRFGFKCIVESIRQRYTLFSPLGVPLRATLSVTLKEYKTLSEQLAELNLQSPDHTKAHVVQQGETLAQISADAYNDPTQWRAIANENSILDPLNLTPGTILQIPVLAIG
ncbi:MAG: LysM peptidoglycan-binding domain-containing protein [Terracidiphilus sp.]|jgi:nucleoid-associated protein YgaU